MGCTLGRVHELHDGAASNTEHDRHFPEVFMGQGLAVTRTLQAMSESSRIIVWAHYVGRVYDQQTWERLKHPLQQRFIADRLGLSLPEYYRRRDVAKQCIRVGLYMDTKPLAIERGFGVLVRQA